MKKDLHNSLFCGAVLLPVLVFFLLCLTQLPQSVRAAESETAVSGADDGLSPETPVLLKVYRATATSVRLTWQQSSNADGYMIYQKSGSSWKRIRRIGNASRTTFTKTGLKKGTTYRYRIRAYRIVNGICIYSSYSKTWKVTLKKSTVSGTYTTGSVYGPSLDKSELNTVRRVVQSFKDNYIRSGMSDYQKLRTAFNYLTSNCTYQLEGWNSNSGNTAYGALVNGVAQCSGYARAMKALCDAMDIPCYYVHASSQSTVPHHQWNLVRLNGKWYIVDASRGYFLLGQDTWNSYGFYWKTANFPKCSPSDHPLGGYFPET